MSVRAIAVLLALFATTTAQGARPADAADRPATRPVAVPTEFLSAAAGRKAIVDDSMQPYFSRLQPMEMSAKTGRPIVGSSLEQQRGECRGRYADAVREFTPEEKDAIQWYLERIVPKTAAVYPLFARTPWSFIKISQTLEGGFPHTRGGHIILPEGVMAGMVRMTHGADARWQALARYGEMLVHEQTHVIQREHPDGFATLYENVWGFQHAGTIQGCEWLTAHQLLDPDAADQNWVFPLREGKETRWIWPLTLLPGEGAGMGEMRRVAVALEPTGPGTFRVKLDAGNMPVMRDLSGLPDYWHRFLPSHSTYHPNEIAADLFARIVLAEQILPGNAPPEANKTFADAKKAFRPLQEQFERIMGGAPTR